MFLPFKIKAVLLATEADYKRLCAADPDFTSLFKITVRCAERFESTAANDMAYAERLAGFVARDKRLPLTAAAVGAMIDDSARRSGHKGSLSLAEDVLCDILAEADYGARQQGAKIIDTDHIQRVLEQRAQRLTHDGSRNAGTP
jgi:predicted ATP-dependent protease